MILDKEEFKRLKKEGGLARCPLIVNSSIDSGNLSIRNNGIFFEQAFKSKIFINFNEIREFQLKGLNIHIKYENDSEITFMFKKNNHAIKFYNEYALINNLETIDINDIKEEEKARKKELFDKIMASNPQVSSNSIQNKSIAKEKDDTVCCPRCGSKSITAQKKGFGLAKGAAGVFVAGAYGVVAAGIGKNKILITCLNCGHRWKPGKK